MMDTAMLPDLLRYDDLDRAGAHPTLVLTG